MFQNNLAVLHVEDNSIDRLNVKRAFERLDVPHALHQVSNGLEALDFIQQFDPDSFEPTRLMVLLDLNMPQMDGFELLRVIRSNERWKHLPVFVMTTSNDKKDKTTAYGLNVSGYILKPLTLDQFSEAIATLNQYWGLLKV